MIFFNILSFLFFIFSNFCAPLDAFLFFLGQPAMVERPGCILSKEVFLLDLLHNEARERMPHLKCVVFIRPTTENINDMCKELRKPRYGEYHVFFSNAQGRAGVGILLVSGPPSSAGRL